MATRKDHGGAVHSEQTVENLWRHEIVVRPDQLNTHERGFNSADDQEQQRVEDIKDTEALVVYGDDPFMEQLHDGLSRQVRGIDGDGFGSHARLSRKIVPTAASADTGLMHPDRDRLISWRASASPA